MRAFAAALLAFLPLAAEDADPTDVLMRLRDRVLAHGERIPNYTCVETITRDLQQPAVQPIPKSCDGILARRKTASFPALLRLATTDRLRLDVALAEGREIYSWAGASRFEEGEIDELIPDGAMGTGPFATMLLSVFRGRPPRFTYEGETKIDGRPVFEYSYYVPLEDSRYRVKAATEWIFTAYTGTLWVDMRTAELVRLAVRTDELPPATQSCETQTTLDYGVVQIGKVEHILPKATRQRFIARDGSEAENRITFASCREYKGESTVRFGGGIADLERGKAGGGPAAVDFPAGLAVSVELAGVIHSNRAAAGDVVQGRLGKPVVDPQGAVLAGAGAGLEGRLMRVETRHGSRPEVVIALRWETIEMNGAMRPITLLPNRRLGDLKIAERVGIRRRGVEIELPAASDTRHGVYHFPGHDVVVESGFRTEWTTAQ